MLEITIEASELFDEEKEEFINIPETKLKLEHSLISIHKWEMKWEKPYYGTDKKTDEEVLDYIRCMVISPQKIDNNILYSISNKNVKEIEEYIGRKMTATWFSERKVTSKTPKYRRPQRVMTAELIYCRMIENNIPMEFAKWHINTLMTLIRVCQEEANPQKMSNRDILKRNHELNKARRAKYHTKG